MGVYYTSPSQLATTGGIITQIPSITFRWGSSTPYVFAEPLVAQSAWDSGDFAFNKAYLDALPANTPTDIITFLNGSTIEVTRSGSSVSIKLRFSDNTYVSGSLDIGYGQALTFVIFEDYKTVGVKRFNSLDSIYYSRVVANSNEVLTWLEGATPPDDIIGTGGGATHIAKVTGVLSALSSNLSDILLVAGGGGGGLIREGTAYVGSDAGGISGNGDNSADQSTGYAFGQGDEGCGGGLYGGNKPSD